MSITIWLMMMQQQQQQRCTLALVAWPDMLGALMLVPSGLILAADAQLGSES